MHLPSSSVSLNFIYTAGSKLKSTKVRYRGFFAKPKRPNDLVGFMTVTSFTKWSFFLLGLAFFLTGLIPFLVVHYEDSLPLSPWLLRAALLLFECAGPTTLLVASVVRYALWPIAIRKGNDTGPLSTPRALVEHNFNVLMALLEVGLLGGIPVRMTDFSVAPLFGLVYVLFSWSMANNWAPPSEGPQYIYFFMDTTLGWKTTISLLVLLAVLTTFYGIFCMASHYISGGVGVNSIAIAVLLSLVCRFRD